MQLICRNCNFVCSHLTQCRFIAEYKSRWRCSTSHQFGFVLPSSKMKFVFALIAVFAAASVSAELRRDDKVRSNQLKSKSAIRFNTLLFQQTMSSGRHHKFWRNSSRFDKFAKEKLEWPTVTKSTIFDSGTVKCNFHSSLHLYLNCRGHQRVQRRRNSRWCQSEMLHALHLCWSECSWWARRSTFGEIASAHWRLGSGNSEHCYRYGQEMLVSGRWNIVR